MPGETALAKFLLEELKTNFKSLNEIVGSWEDSHGAEMLLDTMDRHIDKLSEITHHLWPKP